MIIQQSSSTTSIAALQTEIQSLRASLSITPSKKALSFYEDDSFAFEIDQNGHQVARVKGNDRFKQALRVIQTQKKEIDALKTSKKQLEVSLSSLVDENSKLKSSNKKNHEEIQRITLAQTNLKNQITALMQYVKNPILQQSFKKQFQEQLTQPSTKQIQYKIIQIPIEKEVIVEVAVQREVAVQVPVEIVREVPIFVEKVVQVERIVEVERVVEVAAEPAVVYVERIKEVPVEVTRIKEIQVSVEIEKIVEVQKIVQVERVVQVEKIVEVQKVVQLQKVVEVQVQKIVEVQIQRIVQVLVQRIVQVPVQREIIVQKIVQVQVERLVEVPVEKIIQRVVQVPLQKIVQIQIIKEVPVVVDSSDSSLHSKIESLQSQVTTLKGLLQTEMHLNHENNTIIARMNHQILELTANNAKGNCRFNASPQKDPINQDYSPTTNGHSISRIKILSTHPRKSLPQAFTKILQDVTDPILSQKLLSIFQQLSEKAETQKKSNARLTELLAQSQANNTVQINMIKQAQSQKMVLLGQISNLRRENHQLRVQLQSHESSNQTEHLIEHLTHQLQQQKQHNDEAVRMIRSLSETLDKTQRQLLHKNKQLGSLLQQASGSQQSAR